MTIRSFKRRKCIVAIEKDTYQEVLFCFALHYNVVRQAYLALYFAALDDLAHDYHTMLGTSSPCGVVHISMRSLMTVTRSCRLPLHAELCTSCGHRQVELSKREGRALQMDNTCNSRQWPLQSQPLQPSGLIVLLPRGYHFRAVRGSRIVIPSNLQG
jgi:hypothetical protein